MRALIIPLAILVIVLSVSGCITPSQEGDDVSITVNTNLTENIDGAVGLVNNGTEAIKDTIWKSGVKK